LKRKFILAKYLIYDFLSAASAWTIFSYLQQERLEHSIESIFDLVTPNFFYTLIFIPIFWLVLYSLTGFYNDVFRRSRLSDFFQTAGQSLMGGLLIFFLLILGDFAGSARNYYEAFGLLVLLHFSFTYMPRLVITSLITAQIRKRRLGFNTLLVGDGAEAIELYNEIESLKAPQGQLFVGYVSTSGKESPISSMLPCVGNFNNLSEVIDQHAVEEVIIALSPRESLKIQHAINDLYGKNVQVKVIPSLYDFLTGKVRMSSILGTPLILVNHRLMPAWQEVVKLFLDFVVAFVAVILLLPPGFVVALIIKSTSRGPIFFKQERIGRYGRPFILVKFRSMFSNSEENGPALSSKSDNRVTPFGRFMRKTRLDELPNFINVLKGDMSLVGPRPERQFYIDQIVRKAPYYLHLQKVKPGITSWGQVKYGYAENVDQMIERLKYDILYLENMTLLVDFKIIIYTLITVFRGRGI